ncbi:TRAP transporter substrate-binding protein [uncultured Cohaesibacter sp.]|uniref:TRAP transporter substrate-binding protein n=1 Tax=uncultured Cohaesibacter sp. TaxID=1002546 RepID=UPI00292EBEC5|nr:TRAP transporter substrate-binding protein [uncultured Cohaesibacter sp.]
MRTIVKTIVGGLFGGLLASTTAMAADYQMVLAMQLTDAQNPIYKAFQYIESEIDSRSNGRIDAKLFGGGVLGGDREVAESVSLGDVQLTTMSSSALVPFVPELAVFDLPYIFPHDQGVLKDVLLNSEFSSSLENYMEPKGFRFAGVFNSGFRQLTTADTAVHSVADIEKANLRIRVMENPFHIKLWKLLGAAPTPIAYTELYGALQQGVVDGQENPYINILSSKFYEVQGHLTETSHILLASLILMDNSWYNSLPDDLKAVVDGVLKDAMSRQWEEQGKALSEQKAELAKNMDVITLTPEELEEFRTRTAPMVDEIRASVGDELVDGLLNAIEKASK